jgi:hypoxanthine-DNA glycosylase
MKFDRIDKISFEPIANSDTEILILGTMPGEKSLSLGEYYGHSRNKFWRIISAIANEELPLSYGEKIQLLLKTRIGIWDVVYKAHREGSLDSSIENVQPNDLDSFILKHKYLKVIGFNGIKAESLYDKYFDRKQHIKYHLLPSSSPANTGYDFDTIIMAWQRLVKNGIH